MITDYESYVMERDKHHFTDYYVSKQTGISRSTFSQWKKGEITPSKSTFERINRFFSSGIYKPLPERHSSIMEGNAPIDPAFFMRVEPNMTSYMIRIDESTLVKLDQTEYDELQRAVRCFLYAWMASREQDESTKREDEK